SMTLNPLGVTLAPLQSTILQKCLFLIIFHTSRICMIRERIASYFQSGEVMSDNTLHKRVVNTFTFLLKSEHFYGLEWKAT
ncbi:hypothetical protein, partial [Lysinibacillus sp. D4B2_S17]|uniref:hypothetical protein n=1 Tax=Lysinibacillus sp. D4B2_S17 TaxID=2941225 RepID=UPI0020BD5FDF